VEWLLPPSLLLIAVATLAYNVSLMGSFLIKLFVLLMLAGMLSSFVLAWRFWFKLSSQVRLITWRQRILLSALLAASCDMVLRLLGVYWWPHFLERTHILGVTAFWLLLWGLFAALFGRGAVRACLILYCLLSMIFWMPSLLR
jgi:hypothetical protein